VQALND
jgi:hypothetical protein